MTKSLGNDRLAGESYLGLLLRYKQWAEDIAYDSVSAIGLEEALRSRATTFGNIVMTLNHIHVVDDIFWHHLVGRRHGYTQRNTDTIPDLAALRTAARHLNKRLRSLAQSWTAYEEREPVAFEFVGGGTGKMSRGQIILHLVNHSTYHRGFVGDMLKQVPYLWEANDLTVFLCNHVSMTQGDAY
ncbi:DinB family protein [Sphingomonas sp. ASV193]|uniref:DinB family protein n=1 Tax=Sphingomonas sp. ASV193 TaxID=3144405 RepID=UPI0032E8CCC9